MPSPELLRYFHAEAAEYLDAIEGLLDRADGAPDAGAFLAAARALRGSATMARVPRVADLALVLERIANGMRDGEVAWSADLRTDLRDTAAELRRLVRAAPGLSAGDESRAAQRLAGLREWLPNEPARATPLTPPATTTPIFIALQASAIAGDLESFVRNPGDRALLDDVVSRLRSLRGIAGIAEHPPLGEVADAVERALRELAPDTVLLERDADVLGTAAAVFRRASSDLRATGRFQPDSPEVERFARAAVPLETRATPGDVVRVEELFFTGSGSYAAAGAPADASSRATRFQEQAIARAEHLARLVSDARGAVDAFSRERLRRDLRDHLAALADAARNAGADQIAGYFADLAQEQDLLDGARLEALEFGAGVLATSELSVEDMEQRLAVLERRRRTTPPMADAMPRETSGAQASAGIPHASDSSASVIAGEASSPSETEVRGRSLHAVLERSIAGFEELHTRPLAEPVAVESDAVVPVQDLQYRGRAALQRAIELRDEMRARGAVDDALLQELYDLLDLARTD